MELRFETFTDRDAHSRRGKWQGNGTKTRSTGIYEFDTLVLMRRGDLGYSPFLWTSNWKGGCICMKFG